MANSNEARRLADEKMHILGYWEGRDNTDVKNKIFNLIDAHN